MPIERDPPNPPIGTWGTVWRVAIVVGFGLIAWVDVLDSGASNPDRSMAWYLAVDPALGVVAGVLTRWRRRWPLRIFAIVTVISVISASAGGASVLVLASVATRRRWRELIWVGPFAVVSGVLVEVFYNPRADTLSWTVALIIMVLLIAVFIAIGYAVGGRRELERERVESAARDQERRIAQAAAAERTRIAREMHDVLAHRISLVAMHAGALNFRRDLHEEQRAEIAGTIEANAQQALRDLREVLGVLREPRAVASGPEPPQPGLRDLPDLVAEVTASGMRVGFSDATTDPVPAAVGRTAYRVVQEALTNARKHAPGARVEVGLRGAAEDGLTVEVANVRSVRSLAAPLPESGLGLLGLRERVFLAGGTLEHGSTEDGGYSVRVWLPWPAPETTAEAR